MAVVILQTRASGHPDIRGGACVCSPNVMTSSGTLLPPWTCRPVLTVHQECLSRGLPPTQMGMAFVVAHRNVFEGQRLKKTIKRQVLNDTWLIEGF